MRNILDCEADHESEPSTTDFSPNNHADLFLGVEDAPIVDLQELQPEYVGSIEISLTPKNGMMHLLTHP